MLLHTFVVIVEHRTDAWPSSTLQVLLARLFFAVTLTHHTVLLKIILIRTGEALI